MAVAFKSGEECVVLSANNNYNNNNNNDGEYRMSSVPEPPSPTNHLVYEIRETSLLNNGVGAHHKRMIDKAVQFELMDEVNQQPIYPAIEVESPISSDWSSSGLNETVPVQARSNDTTAVIASWREELKERDDKDSTPKPNPPPQEEQNKDDRPRYKINESNPTGPDPNAATWRITDRHRQRNSSGSEDEIEKMDGSLTNITFSGLDSESVKAKDRWTKEDGDGNAISGRSTATGGGKPPGAHPNEPEEGDCLIQCLSYTLQCCECVIS